MAKTVQRSVQVLDATTVGDLQTVPSHFHTFANQFSGVLMVGPHTRTVVTN